MKRSYKTFLGLAAIIIIAAFLFLNPANTVSAANTNISYTATATEVTVTRFHQTSSETAVIPDTIEGKPVTAIGQNAFAENKTITTVKLPDTIKTIDSSAFSGCSNLSTINLPKSLTHIKGYAFFECFSLTKITVPDSIEFIGERAFMNCTALSSITLPEKPIAISAFVFYNTAFYNDSSNWENHVLYIGSHLITTDGALTDKYAVKEGTRYIANYGLRYNRELVAVKIPNSVEHIGGYVFDGCVKLSSVIFPRDISTLNWGMFSGSGIKAYRIPDSVTDITYKMFDGCSSLESITIPGSVKTIGESTFFGCVKMTEITIPEGVTSIEDHAFTYCENLKKIILPSTITHISANAFSKCSALKDILFCGTEEQWYKIDTHISQDDVFGDPTDSPLLNANITFEYVIPKPTETISETSVPEPLPESSAIIPETEEEPPASNNEQPDNDTKWLFTTFIAVLALITSTVCIVLLIKNKKV